MDIRLRLTIRRHGVPEIKLVWPCTASDDLTIASLLAQINDVVVLESGQWGLEDYAVELADVSGNSFECLHFQPVRKVFKQDDQVLIRSLSTEDVKQRRASGRHQISSDGIHLVDGIPFGRRRAPPGRPQLELPPRKRARIVYDADEDEDDSVEEDALERMLLEDTPRASEKVDHFRSNVHNADVEEEDEPDQDYATENDAEVDADDYNMDEDEDLEEEIRLLQADNDIIGDHFFDSEEEQNPQPELPRLSPQAAKAPSSQPLLQEITPAAVNALQMAFPSTPASAIRDALQNHQTDIHNTYRDLSTKDDPTMSFDKVLQSFLAERFANTKSSPGPSLLPETPKVQSRPLIQVVEADDPLGSGSPLSNDVDDGDAVDASSSSAETSSSSDSDSSSSDEASLRGHDKEESDLSDDESSDSDSDESHAVTSPEASMSADGGVPAQESSASDSSSDSEAGSDSQASSVVEPNSKSQHGHRTLREHVSMIPVEQNEQKKSKRRNSSSSMSKDVGRNPMSAISGRQKRHKIEVVSSSDSSDSDDASSSSDDSEDSDEASSDSDSSPDELSTKKPPAKATIVPPDAAQTETARPAQATVPRGQGMTKTQKRNARRKLAKQHAKAARAPASTSEADELAARKKALLSAVSQEEDTHATDQSGQLGQAGMTEVDEPHECQDPVESADISQDVPTELSSVDMEVDADANAEEPVGVLNQAAVSEDTASVDTPRRRVKMDKDAGRRLLFGALGLKNPKSKADEEKIKEKLMKDVRPLKNHRQEETTQQQHGTPPVDADGEEDDNEDWRAKITYRAVECCHEGMQLSEPPFPFVQRWDPQQQYGAMRKRKRQSQEYYQDYDYEDGYDDESYNYEGYEETHTPKKSKKSKKKSKQNGDANDESMVEDNIVLNYDDAPKKTPAGESQFTDYDDLPSLPPDVTTLAPLTLDTVTSGMVICWKELQMSKATSWQPTMALVTALVISVEDNTIHVILAKRDRPEDDREYDQTTGKRIYDKFEAPDNSDDDMGNDLEHEGHRWVNWSDMVEPRVVQSAPSPRIANSPGPEADDQHTSIEPTIEVESAQITDSVDKDPANGEEEDIPTVSSIPSGQTFPRFEPLDTTSALDNTAVSSRTDDSQAQSGSDGALRQRPQGPQAIVEDSQPPPVASESAQMSRDERFQPQQEQALSPGSEESVLAENSNPSVNVTLASPGQEPDERQSPLVEYPQLPPFPSSAGSLRSGRQPNPEDEIMNDAGDGDDTVIHHDIGSPDDEADAVDGEEDNMRPHGSSSPLPSLDDTWLTAKTTKSSQSPLKSSQMSALSKRKGPKSGYEEAMERLDEGDESELSPDRNTSIRSLFPNATQPSPAALGVSADRGIANSKQEKFAGRRRLSPFQLPEGSQVIELISNPVSPRPVEHYPDDSMDETYQDEEDEEGSSLPHGSGWVQKNKVKRESRRPNKDSSAALSSSPAGGTRAKNRSLPWPSSAAPAGQGRRRMSKKF
ncbi:uncharacterized protein F5Z01DRAFT_553512 [Emericellopsis atlantica]|uniref:DUF7357 domain-containing protein n=1 Tax=Emericellopsis atlantica TaxID=2614577 RepID=A0A9P7ZP46_9HYPO|nr:uncharacterized protein F5Z01DRAFT_553512 [Emericellopsis atlantica]KAG9255699.1 hypothetical protein F5Z01DRAFT_553512 [Emericellopsis atlantica]